MELLTAELRQLLPRLYAQEGSNDPIVYEKFFTPDSSWTWFVTEGSPDDGDFRFFGYVIAHFRAPRARSNPTPFRTRAGPRLSAQALQ